MKKIRTKMIFILAAAVLLPVIPLSYFVYNLVNQSFRIGVNSQVEEALENGLYFSKAVYDLQRRQLATALEVFENSGKFRDTADDGPARISPEDLPVDTAYWQIASLHFFDASGSEKWHRDFMPEQNRNIDSRLFKQFESPDQRSLIISDRAQNSFIALEKVGEAGRLKGYLVLKARLHPNFLNRADQALNVHQIYQTLDLTRTSLLHSFLYAFLALALFLVALAVVVGIWMSARITAPLSLLAEGTAQIGRGNLDYRLPENRRNDELGKLMDHFNGMAHRLKENQERLIYLEKMAVWKQMARKLAHEIKNPLTPIQLTLQQLVDKYDEKNSEYGKLLSECSGIINEEIGSLRRLVSSFSDFGRLPELQLAEGNLNELVVEVSALYGDRIACELNPDIPAVLFDPDRLRRVLINLIENAVQADSGNHPVTVRTELLDGRVWITVEDRGSGIPAEQVGKIFEPYFSTKKEGMGLGLSITRLIVEEHNGTIRVETEAEKGSRFIIELPAVSID